MNQQQKAYNFVSIFLLAGLCFLLFRNCNDKKTFENLVSESQSELKTYIDKDGLQHAKIVSLTGSVNDLRKLNSKQDSTLRKLQELVDKKTQSATIIDNSTITRGGSKTQVSFEKPTNHTIVFKPSNIEKIDTIPLNNKQPCDTIFPIYKTSWNDAWSQGLIRATKDSIFRDIKIFNETDIVDKLERPKWWKEEQLTIDVKNKNPNTKTIDLKTFVAGGKRARPIVVFLGGIIVGSIVTATGIIYILK